MAQRNLKDHDWKDRRKDWKLGWEKLLKCYSKIANILLRNNAIGNVVVHWRTLFYSFLGYSRCCNAYVTLDMPGSIT